MLIHFLNIFQNYFLFLKRLDSFVNLYINYQPNPNTVKTTSFVNGKFKPDDTKIFFIGMGSMCKAIKDNVLKPNGITGPGQYRIQLHFFLDL